MNDAPHVIQRLAAPISSARADTLDDKTREAALLTAIAAGYDAALTHPGGEAFAPPSWADLEDKFTRASVKTPDPVTRLCVIEALTQLRAG